MIMLGSVCDRVIAALASDGSVADRADEGLSAHTVQLAAVVPGEQSVALVLAKEAGDHLLAVDGKAHAPHTVGRQEPLQWLKLLPVLDQEANGLKAVVGGRHACVHMAVEAMDVPVAAHPSFSLFLDLALASDIQA